MVRRLHSVGLILLLAGAIWSTPASAEDLVTLSGTTYHNVYPLRVEPDGVTWQHDNGMVKVDFADCPETVRRAYHYDAAKAAAYRDAQEKARQHADEQAQHAAKEHETRQRARAEAAVGQTAATDGESALVLRRALSPAASNTTRETAARMQADTERRAAETAANPDRLNLIRPLPGIFGPRPINAYMDTPNEKEFAASLRQSPTGATGNFVPSSADPTRSSLNDDFYQPLYQTRSYYDDLDRAAAFALGNAPKQ